jgi:uncharacterized ferritin-like protein (DUF455 family)
MNDFLMTISLGEFVAASNAKLLSRFFRHEGDEALADTYDTIGQDEIRHFKLMREVVGAHGNLPEEMRKIYKGALLDVEESLTVDCAFERMAVMHTVFEGASFAYMSIFAKTDDRLPARLREVAAQILMDEADHMMQGFKAIDAIKPRVSADRIAKTRDVVDLHAQALRRLPDMTIDPQAPFSAAVVSLYDKNVSKNIKRAFG